jgi:hypothetical protein
MKVLLEIVSRAAELRLRYCSAPYQNKRVRDLFGVVHVRYADNDAMRAEPALYRAIFAAS